MTCILASELLFKENEQIKANCKLKVEQEKKESREGPCEE
jgi:hypothetical protein